MNHQLKSRRNNRPHHRSSKSDKAGDGIWLYGLHTVNSALKNPARQHIKLLQTKNAGASLAPLPSGLRAEIVESKAIDAALPEGAVHQGVALLTKPLLDQGLSSIEPVSQHDVVVVLDQVSDPHNIGAILRSCAAFGAKALILQSRHSPALNGVLAKAASGALEHVPVIQVTNIARTLSQLVDLGFDCLGLAEEGQLTLGEYKREGPVALVLGAEGPGLRRLTRETCTSLVRLPTSDIQSSLNVSNAAAVSLYALSSKH